jgi:Domain of unknown function (DUF5615)
LKALLNAHLSPRLAQALRERGHDVVALVERDDIPDSAPDSLVMKIAATEGRAVVTNNIKDFRSIAANRIISGEGHSGLLLIPHTVMRTRAATAGLAEAIDRLLDQHQAGIENAELWVSG